MHAGNGHMTKSGQSPRNMALSRSSKGTSTKLRAESGANGSALEHFATATCSLPKMRHEMQCSKSSSSNIVALDCRQQDIERKMADMPKMIADFRVQNMLPVHVKIWADSKWHDNAHDLGHCMALTWALMLGANVCPANSLIIWCQCVHYKTWL